MNMKVKCFDYEHELDLEKAINAFLSQNEINIINVCYSVSHFPYKDEQIFSFSALIFYSNIE